jgi:hypothetical protein
MTKRSVEPVGEKPSDEPVMNTAYAHHTVEVWAELHPTGTVQELLEYLGAEAVTAAETYVSAYAERYPSSELAEAEAFARSYVKRMFEYRRSARKRVVAGNPPTAT